MAREKDARARQPEKVTSARRSELESRATKVSSKLPGVHRVTIAGFDATTGNPTRVVSESAPAEKGNYIQRALDHVQNISRALGLEAAQPVEFTADPHFQTASSGAVAVHLQQRVKGIPVFQSALAVHFSPKGALTETVGAAASVTQDKPVSPKLSVQDAVLKAAQYVAMPQQDEKGAKDQFGQPLEPASVDLTGFQPEVTAMFPDKAERPAVLAPGPFGDGIRANLTWFPLGDDLRLAWETILTMPRYQGQFRTIVDAENGDILYCHQLVQTAAGRGNVYLADGRAPRQLTEFPRPLAGYGLPIPTLPPGFPDTWVSGDQTIGNSVHARLGAGGSAVRGTVQNGVVTFDPAQANDDDQKVLNIFYYNCFMHDFFYMLGFREADGNFQHDNLGRGGAASDRVDARAHSGAIWGTANMATPMDGLSPAMNMGLVTSTNRHTAFDSSVVFHEFTHGVTNRLVGGPLDNASLELPQSRGMGEGWSDYIACTINDNTVVGDWVVDRSGGIRGYPYDENFPDGFDKLGTGRYTEEHNIGEVWCATLMELNRKIGKHLALQLVVDALKLSPTNPSFLSMRDAILAALDAMRDAGRLSSEEYTTVRNGIWSVFAKFGMGPGARSNGAYLTGIVADTNVPQGVPGRVVRAEVAPNVNIPDNDPAGVTSVLSIPQSGRITWLTVSIEIDHPFIGDLRAALTSPGGSAIVLHDRTGAGTDNLVASYTDQNVPALAALTGQEARGDWTLNVSDRAALDRGRLRRWSVEIGLDQPNRIVRGEATPGLQIPDNEPAGVTSMIKIPEQGIPQAIEVAVDVTHTHIGDLRIELLAPSGTRAMLHNMTGGGADSLITTYDSAASQELAALLGGTIQGDWLLRVTDLAGEDVGKLNRWSLEFTIK